jgi:hypothetical protein
LLRLLDLTAGGATGVQGTASSDAIHGLFLRGATCFSNILANCGGGSALISDAKTGDLERLLKVGMGHPMTRDVSQKLLNTIVEIS